jgi:TonB family protein
MVAEVKVGNQTALRSKKHPFARYIATMHREIHRLWAYGFLEQLDTRGGGHPMNDASLWTRLEVVLNGDGTIDNVKVVHYSGLLSFDQAAREIVYAAGPFPNPPRAIKSGNGKIYIHWAFHRNERACGTFGATPYVLDNAGQGDRPNAHAEVRMPGGGGGGRRLSRGGGAGGGGDPHAGHSHSQARHAKAGGQEGPALPPGVPASRGGGGGGAGGAAGAAPAGAGEQAAPPSGPTQSGKGQAKPRGLALGPRVGSGAPPPSPTPPVESSGVAVDPQAKPAAVAWVRAFAKRNITGLMGRSSVPFKSGGRTAARTKPELQALLGALAEEAPAGNGRVEGVFTAAGVRKRFGSLPSGVHEGSRRLYAVVRLGGDTFVLMLEKRFGSWRAVGLTR